MLDPGLIWKIVSGLTLLVVFAIYLWTIFLKPPKDGPPHFWLWLLVALSLAGCHTVRFESIAHRPAEYGGGYLVVGECWKEGRYEPCFWLCSPDGISPSSGPVIVCGQVPWEDWGE